MSLAVLVRPLVSGILLAGVGSHAPPNACALLTLTQLSAAIGQPVLGGNPSQSADSGGICSYGYGAVNQISVELFQFPSAAAAQKKLADELKDSQTDDKGTHKTKVETGVADGAFSTTADMGTMKVVTLSAVRGSRVFNIFTMTQVALSSDRLRSLMQKALSR